MTPPPTSPQAWPRRRFLAATACAGGAAAARLAPAGEVAAPAQTDVCVYGGTASGVAAAIAAADRGLRVTVVEPSRWLGGMSGGGLSVIDWGVIATVGATARKLLIERDDPGMRRLYARELADRGVEVVHEHRLGAVTKRDGRIESIVLDHAPPDALGCPAAAPSRAHARTLAARMFVDCSYEGDLLARSGVRYTWGRESREEHGESLAGVRPVLARYAIDPYAKPGDPRSGLLPLLQDVAIGPPGSADRLTMAYAFRWQLTRTDPIRVEPPDDYDPRRYEIFRRGFLHGVDMRAGSRMRRLGVLSEERGAGVFGANSSRALWAQSVAGENAAYPDGDWPVRSRIWREQMDFVRGMYHFLRTDPAVPPDLREKAETTGFKPGVFDDTAGWPHQLYVREARRMRSAYVVTQRDLEGLTAPEDSVGLGSYGVDDWPYATVAADGGIALSGGEFSILKADPERDGVHRIPYRSIVPRAEECANLLVPVCCSASHVAMTSIRMEPVWITLGVSAGIAAAHAIEEGVAVQAIDFPRYRRALVAAGQILDWAGGRAGAWDSREAWNAAKPGYEWLFPAIDRDGDGAITPEEYRAFQAFKHRHDDWERRLRRPAAP